MCVAHHLPTSLSSSCTFTITKTGVTSPPRLACLLLAPSIDTDLFVPRDVMAAMIGY